MGVYWLPHTFQRCRTRLCWPDSGQTNERTRADENTSRLDVLPRVIWIRFHALMRVSCILWLVPVVARMCFSLGSAADWLI